MFALLSQLRFHTLALVLCAVVISCAPQHAEKRTPWLVFGIDGAEWAVIEAMWEKGELPHLKSLAEQGVRARLKTAYSQSPVIWTSIATGVSADRHGIVDFVIPTADGDIPLSSEQRKVPAIWNVMTWLDRPVAVFGWWATWPVEPVNGIMVSDRFGRNLDAEAFPTGAADGLDSNDMLDLWQLHLASAVADRARDGEDNRQTFSRIHGNDIAQAALTRRAVAAGTFDLILGYFRTVDVVSHRDFGCWDRHEPSNDGCRPGVVRAAYSLADDVLGSILEAAQTPINVLVVSDHGFQRLKPQYRVSMDFDKLLEFLGYLKRNSDGSIDLTTSRFVGHANPTGLRFKNVRRLPKASDEDERRLREQLLSLRYESGAPVFAMTRRRGSGSDIAMVLRVTRYSPSRTVSGDGVEEYPLVHRIVPMTGTHSKRNDGILIAAGPDIANGRLERVHIFDIAPTLAYGLDLPVAEDADGQVRESLFNEGFRQRHQVETVSSWGLRDGTEAHTGSIADQEILEELRALGYLD